MGLSVELRRILLRILDFLIVGADRDCSQVVIGQFASRSGSDANLGLLARLAIEAIGQLANRGEADRVGLFRQLQQVSRDDAQLLVIVTGRGDFLVGIGPLPHPPGPF
jgi:hypothetical protein